MKLALYFFLRKLVPSGWLQAAVREYQRCGNWLKYGDRHFFREVNIEISQACNFRCHYCPQSLSPLPKAFMSQEIFTAILQRLQEIHWKGPVGYAHYNEPTLDARLPDFIRQTKVALPDSMPHLFTNGSKLTPQFTQELIDAGVVNFAVTRHPQGVKSWETKIKPLALLFPNYFTLADLNGLELSNRGGLITDPGVTIQKMDRCDDPEGSLHISINGDALLCGCDYKGEHVFGNLLKQGLLEIWRNRAFTRVRDEVRLGKPRLNICKGCFRSPDFVPALI